MLQQRLLLQKIVLSLVNLGALTTRTQADVAIQRAGARALLLGKTIWVYGGFSNNLQNPLNTAATLDVSVPWSVGSPAWKERADDPTVAPFSQFGTMFPTTDQTGFYLSDQYGGTNKTYGMAKFDATNYKWTILPVSNFSVLPPR
ncbi:hypothetical protein BC938DRAFT_477276 [Jimgerdemannia flammicorona]|uniref:Galactose oxidase n=1 Tax=Jimgerdemannia flammicorona TaxID=994334 RepID=A0A433PAW0_9FUNG|nr:hypothetical protein BC938DRAFT_477276 [Jimgerdemannia flammicorona]